MAIACGTDERRIRKQNAFECTEMAGSESYFVKKIPRLNRKVEMQYKTKTHSCVRFKCAELNTWAMSSCKSITRNSFEIHSTLHIHMAGNSTRGRKNKLSHHSKHDVLRLFGEFLSSRNSPWCNTCAKRMQVEKCTLYKTMQLTSLYLFVVIVQKTEVKLR